MGQQLAIDVGAVYLRVVVLLPGPPDESLTVLDSLYSPPVEGTYYLLKYTPDSLESFANHPIFSRLSPSPTPVYISGIGGKLVRKRIESCYGVKLRSTANTPCLMRGLEYLRVHHPDTFFFFPGSNMRQISSIGRFNDMSATKIKGVLEGDFYPCLLLNLRSGLSIYRLDSPTDHRRIQGSCLGGTTIWSILKLLTPFQSPEEAVRASVEGDNTHIDMSVGDIYGCTYDQAGLNSELIASSCAKLRFTENPAPQDLAKSLFGMFILNFTQITWFISQAEDVGKIIVTGNIITVPGLMDAAQACMNFWSKGTKQLLFNEYSFYMGALGALID